MQPVFNFIKVYCNSIDKFYFVFSLFDSCGKWIRSVLKILFPECLLKITSRFAILCHWVTMFWLFYSNWVIRKIYASKIKNLSHFIIFSRSSITEFRKLAQFVSFPMAYILASFLFQNLNILFTPTPIEYIQIPVQGILFLITCNSISQKYPRTIYVVLKVRRYIRALTSLAVNKQTPLLYLKLQLHTLKR